jgi:hypothetical protein
MARSNFPAEADTKPAAPRSRPSSEELPSERPSARPTVPAPSGRYRVAAAAEPKLEEVPPLPKFPAEEGPPVRRLHTPIPIKRTDQSLATTVRPKRFVAHGASREEYAPRKRDPREE